jgi:uncharacterized membrane protein YedE/YeeE
MTIDWLNFSPWSALAGGALIGLAAAIFVLCNGRVAGISGLLGSLLMRGAEGRLEKGMFVLGVLLAPLMWQLFSELPVIDFQGSWWGLLVAGLLVGLGSRYGSGCTSGHGVCGLSRLSGRSLVATLSFMSAGFATVWIIRHLLGG